MRLRPGAMLGVDGCKGGWIAVEAPGGDLAAATAAVHASFAVLLQAVAPDTLVAVDMPIGLPDSAGHGGRGPESLIRPLLGQRQSSVFSIPSRAAVYAEVGPFDGVEAWYAAHRRASAVARATSAPARGVSIQAFGLFARIREIDTLLRQRPELRPRIRESHPELAFCRLNGGRAMRLPKKVAGAVNPAGMEERKALLAGLGYRRAFLDAAPPRGAGADDFLDAAAMLLVARRIADGRALSFPDPPGVDGHGIAVAIWA